MLDNIGTTMDRLIEKENSKVIGASIPTRIKKENYNDGNNKKNFKETLKKKRDIKIEIEAVKEETAEIGEDNIIISSSLNEKLEEQKLISRLVNEKFVDNPLLQRKIGFDK